MATSLAPLRNRFARRWFVPLIALFVLASALALANDESWPYPVNSFTFQGWQGDWKLLTRELQDLREEFWCFDRDRDGLCEEWRYQNSNGDHDVCEDPDEDGVCNHREKIYSDGSYIERLDVNQNGFQEYVHTFHPAGADYRQWNQNDNSSVYSLPGETPLIPDHNPSPLFFGFTREIVAYSLPGETPVEQHYQISPLVVRWSEGGTFFEQVWDSNGDSKLDSYCHANMSGCNAYRVAITPEEALGLVTFMQDRSDNWQKRVDSLTSATPTLTQRYVYLQYQRCEFVLNHIKMLAVQTY